MLVSFIGEMFDRAAMTEMIKRPVAVEAQEVEDRSLWLSELTYEVFGGDPLAYKIADHLTRNPDSWEEDTREAIWSFVEYFQTRQGSSIASPRLSYAQTCSLIRFVSGLDRWIRDDIHEILCSLRYLGRSLSTEEREEAKQKVYDTFVQLIRYRYRKATNF